MEKLNRFKANVLCDIEKKKISNFAEFTWEKNSEKKNYFAFFKNI